jgi:predicted nucleic acid-binding protein
MHTPTSKIRLYIDTSVYNRPFDDQSQHRIWFETLAFSIVLQMIETGEVELISSWVLEFENSRNPFAERRQWVTYYLSFASSVQEANDRIKKRATTLEKVGIDSIDALHIASAEVSGATHFLTCDDDILKKYTQLPEKRLNVCNPVKFIMEML